MNRPFVHLWRYFFADLLGLAVATACWLAFPLRIFLLPFEVALFLETWWRTRWLWRLGKRVRHFQTNSGPKVILHYQPGVEERWNFSVLHESMESTLDELSEWFGFALPGRLVVFLFRSRDDLCEVFGRRSSGRALILANAIVIADDATTEELTRHEIAHLFSGRWNMLAPPILSEGLSTWFQRSFGGVNIDALAQHLFMKRDLQLNSLLSSRFFISEPQRSDCYVLAGSFTGFLIRRFGWERYRKFFRNGGGLAFKRNFSKVFGLSFDAAESRWRTELAHIGSSRISTVRSESEQ